MMSSVWKGKYFYPDGCFTNMWLGFKAVDAKSYVGTSLLSHTLFCRRLSA